MVFSAPAMLTVRILRFLRTVQSLDDQPDPVLFLKFGRVGNQSVTGHPSPKKFQITTFAS